MPCFKRYVLRIRQSFSRSDMRQSPVKAVWRRAWWKIRWRLNHSLWPMTLSGDVPVLVPRTGAGALIYYLGNSEPAIAQFITRFLRPGQVVFDVGAHLGEYTLLAAHRVGSTGRVYAFEPNPEMAEVLQRNVMLNQVTQVHVFETAAADHDGEAAFELHREASISALLSRTADRKDITRTIQVPVRSLDSVWEWMGNLPVNLIKIDVEGAELEVLKGATRLLKQPPDYAPVLVFEYSPRNYARFGHTGADVLEYLHQYGYVFFRCEAQGVLVPSLIPDLISAPPELLLNLIAAKGTRVEDVYVNST